MRTIKFRAWDKNKKEIREVTEINWYDEFMWVDETPMSGDKLPIEGTPLMQFTGLLDKQGKEIYEGDIVTTEEFVIDGECVKARRFEVVWSDTMFTLRPRTTMTFTHHHQDMIEVIGNIYESKHLLDNTDTKV